MSVISTPSHCHGTVVQCAEGRTNVSAITPGKHMRNLLKTRIAAAALAATFAVNVQAAEITGAGATFIYPLLSKWSDDYNKATGHRVNYQSIGSGGGIAQIKAGTVDFGSSDKPLPPEELAAAGLGQFPSAIGAVVPVVNLPSV